MALTIAVTGARGFIGARVAERLSADHRVLRLSRAIPLAAGTVEEWRRCDLFSLKDAQSALEGVDVVYYLVHSMLPTARLDQGGFEDLDVIAADNLAIAAKRCGVKQIIYLGGLIPQGPALSKHLASRLEVEEVLASRGVPVTVLRAGLVVGKAGSSFQMLVRLVRRLPIMICPKWMNSRTQPIDVRDAVSLLAYCAGRADTFGQVFDIGSPDRFSYRDMIQRTARAMGRDPWLIPFPAFTTKLSTLWVRLVTGAPGNLVAPLVESLNHEMLARDLRLQGMAQLTPRSFDESLRDAVGPSEVKARPVAFQKPTAHVPEARSVQRLPLPHGKDANWVAREYPHWLARHLTVLRAEVSGEGVVRFFLRPLATLLLELTYSSEASRPDRALFYITGGALARLGGRGRLEFRQIPGKQQILAAVHEFRPRLPWWLYRLTQARFHLWVMTRFGRYLAKV